MTNREKLLQSNEYDLLCRMNENIRNFTSPCNPCIYIAFGAKRRLQRCGKFNNDCKECIAAWLNEKAV